VTDGGAPPLRLLMIGESTAAGVGAESHADGLPGLTARAVAGHTGRSVAWRVLGRNGATARAALTDLLAPAEDVRADVAVIVLGVNDTLRFHSPARWRRDLAALVAAVRERCGPIPVVLAGVPPVGRFPALPQPLRGVLGLRAALLDHTARRLAAELPAARHVGTPVLDASVDAYFCADRFHPSPRGYATWAAALGESAAALVTTARDTTT
jgi:lysophospholipase L1-like esterase